MPMKIVCPRCQKKLNVTEQYAGKAIRCPACNHGFKVPKPREAAVALPGDDAPDLMSLAKLEARTGAMDSEVQADLEAKRLEELRAAGEGKRICNWCNKEVRAKDPYAELLCSHCGRPIPALIQGRGIDTGGAVLVGAKNIGNESRVGFYSGVGTMFSYPFGAAQSLLMAVGIAFAAIFFPVVLSTSLQRAVEQGQSGTATGVEQQELTGLASSMMYLFYAEIVFFGLIGLHAVVEVSRATSVGDEAPPSLVWNPQSWGESLIGMVIVTVLYLGVLAGAVYYTAPDSIGWISDQSQIDLAQLKSPLMYFTVGLVIVMLPMTIVGLAAGKLSQALDPVRIVKSIVKTHINYMFLLLLFIVLMLLFFGVGGVVLEWFGGEIQELQKSVTNGKIGAVSQGMAAWGAVMGIGFYMVYVLGRVLGLFARTYKKQLLFNS